MKASLISYIGNQPLMKIIHAFLRSPEPRYLRELCSACALSPGGVSDILRRLSLLGILNESKIGNRKCYKLMISSEERKSLELLFSLYEEDKLRENAKLYSNKAAEKLEWMDETYSFFQKVKAEN